MSLESVSFFALVPGPHVVIFGAIHGDEVCGPNAIRNVIAELETGDIDIARGKVTFVPVCNPNAYLARTRLVEENLNRVFRRTETPASYEALLANTLCALMDTSDVFIDLHSQNAPGPVSLFTDYPEEERNTALADALPGEYILLGWPAVYEGKENDFGSFSTNRYAHEVVGATEVLVECGQNEDPAAAHVAREVILRALAHLEMINLPPDLNETTAPKKKVRMKQIFAHEHPNDRFTKEWEHLEFAPRGTCVAERASGEQIILETDSLVIFPKITAVPGEEWFYLGEQE